MPESKMAAPKNDAEYFELMNRVIFQAGLNWKMIENKWENFQGAFSGFSVEKVAKFGEKDIKSLMQNVGIVRNEKKIRAAVFNANAILRTREEFGSFKEYLDGFGGDNSRLIADLQERFHHLGPSSARVFLMRSGVKLKPTKEELGWHVKAQKMSQK